MPALFEERAVSVELRAVDALGQHAPADHLADHAADRRADDIADERQRPADEPAEDRARGRVEQRPRNRRDDDLDDDGQRVDERREPPPAGNGLAHALEPWALTGRARSRGRTRIRMSSMSREPRLQGRRRG